MKKTILSVTLVFLLFFGYLQQKVDIYKNAYELNMIEKERDKLVDTRDVLLYNFTKKVSLENINSWVEANESEYSTSSVVLALNVGSQVEKRKENGIVLSLQRMFNGAGLSKAVAQEQR